jgi:hypothetical protein
VPSNHETIRPHPGSPNHASKWPCSGCSRVDGRKGRSGVECDVCLAWWHASCAGVNLKSTNATSSSVPWTCLRCSDTSTFSSFSQHGCSATCTPSLDRALSPTTLLINEIEATSPPFGGSDLTSQSTSNQQSSTSQSTAKQQPNNNHSNNSQATGWSNNNRSTSQSTPNQQPSTSLSATQQQPNNSQTTTNQTTSNQPESGQTTQGQTPAKQQPGQPTAIQQLNNNQPYNSPPTAQPVNTQTGQRSTPPSLSSEPLLNLTTKDTGNDHNYHQTQPTANPTPASDLPGDLPPIDDVRQTGGIWGCPAI